MKQNDADTLWYQPDLDVFLNRWFSNYEEARRSLESEGGFLLPYKQHFYICQPEAIRALGLDPEDADWELIGRDCPRPADERAFERLRDKREQVVEQLRLKLS
jgi:hypothetical protein